MTRQEQVDIDYMRQALALARCAAAAGEVPVGALVVQDDVVIGTGFNQTIVGCDPSAHAEVVALRNAGQSVANHRLGQSTLYVTLEPCLMCCGCLQHARINRLVFGAREPRTGAVVSINETLADPNALHSTAVSEGVLAVECTQLLQQFFQDRR